MEPDYTRTAVMLLDEYRGGKLGRISLEWPPGNARDAAAETAEEQSTGEPTDEQAE